MGLRCCESEHGSVLILMPAVVMVVLMLGAISVDAAVVYLGHRELSDFAASAADTAAAKALDRQQFYAEGGRLRLDPVMAQAVVDDLRTSLGGGGLEITGAWAEVSPDGRTVTVTALGIVHEVFAPAVGGHRTASVRAVAIATVLEVSVRGP